MLPYGFVFLDSAVPAIRWDAKYATADNFTGGIVRGYETNRVAGTWELAKALARAQSLCAPLGYGLFLWDGYRPQRAVDHFLRWVGAPEDGKTQKSHYPNLQKADLLREGYIAAKSGHSRASTVDLTLFSRASGALLEMGGDFDFMDVSSAHDFLEISETARKNRALLKDIMESSGLRAYEREWWHYTLCDEPYPDTYFDFPIAE